QQGVERTGAVGGVPGEHHADDRRRERDGEGGGVEAQTVERGGDRRHRGGDGERLERAEGDEGEHADEDGALRGAGPWHSRIVERTRRCRRPHTTRDVTARTVVDPEVGPGRVRPPTSRGAPPPRSRPSPAAVPAA